MKLLLRSHVRFVLYLCFYLIYSQLLTAQNVGVTLLPPPPNQMHISDMWHILLFNNDAVTYKIYLHSTAYVGFDKSGKQIADAQTRVIDLPPSRSPLRITGSMVQPVKVNKSDSHYESIIRNTGTVPSGEYYFCVNVVDASTGASMAEACLEHTVENYSPPILVSPEDASVLTDSMPTFSWLALAPISIATSLRYNLRITEIIGDQSPQQSMLANHSWFERNDIPSTMFLYPFSARGLVNKKSYAWRIQAVDPKDNTPLAESEVWSFRRNDTTNAGTTKDSVPNPITSGLLAAGDQFSEGIFETKQEQRAVLSKLKTTVSTTGQAKYTLGGTTDFRSTVLTQNVNASEYNLVSSAQGASGVVLNNNKYQVANEGISSVQSKLGNLASLPSIDHVLWTWGRNVEQEVGYLAPGWYSDVPLPYDLKNIQQLACGANHTLMLMKDGTVWAWGDNQFGQLANSVVAESNVAMQVSIPGAGKVVQLAAGMGTSFALKDDGNIYAWGYNACRELGIIDDTSHEQLTPRLIDVGEVRFRRIAARGGHALAVSARGEVYGWGSNYFGEVGNGMSHVRINYPVPILTPEDVHDKSTSSNGASGSTTLMMNVVPLVYKSVSCGDHSSFALGSAGNDVFAWGRNASGQLLNSTTRDTASPVRLNLSKIDTISAGGAHTVVVITDGSIKVGGNNMSGQLGEPKLGISSTPLSISGFGQIIAVATGASHTMVIKKTGGLWTMGLNNSGQLAVSPIHDIIFSNKPAMAPARITSLEQ